MRPVKCLLLATIAVAALAGCDRRQAAQPQPPAPAAEVAPKLAETPVGGVDRSHKGMAAPAIPFARGDGAPATLAGFRGKPLLVNLWATWCGPCIRELPTLDRLAAEKDAAFRVVAVSQDSKGGPVPAFLKAHGVTHLAPYLDTRNVLLGATKAASLPTTILYDARGREIWRVASDLDWAGPAAARLLAEAR